MIRTRAHVKLKLYEDNISDRFYLNMSEGRMHWFGERPVTRFRNNRTRPVSPYSMNSIDKIFRKMFGQS
jgi:hypothetical protein